MRGTNVGTATCADPTRLFFGGWPILPGGKGGALGLVAMLRDQKPCVAHPFAIRELRFFRCLPVSSWRFPGCSQFETSRAALPPSTNRLFLYP